MSMPKLWDRQQKAFSSCCNGDNATKPTMAWQYLCGQCLRLVEFTTICHQQTMSGATISTVVMATSIKKSCNFNEL